MRARFLFSFLVLLLVPLRPTFCKDPWLEVRSPNFTVIGNVSESSAREIADHFEQFRELFQNAFPKVRVDLGKPLVIFAMKNEESMRLLLPEYWETKGRVHPDGIYIPGEDKHFVVLRANAESENPYRIIYHEYTHALADVNFRGLPLWLSEGIAEFLGNSTLHEKSAEIGNIAPYHVQVVQQNRLIPIEELLQADASFPYYNEADRTTMFYAESWMLVHYLMLDPDARQRQLLQKYLDAWDSSGNSLDAAQKTFGDLKKFAGIMEKYANQPRFVGTVNTTLHPDPKSYNSRMLSQAEIDAARGEFYVHTQRPKEARAALDAAVHAQPNLAEGHRGLGELAYFHQDQETAEQEFTKAAELNSKDFANYFYMARALMHHGMATPEQSAQVAANLERSISLNPNFAPAYSALASIYSTRAETREKAFAAGRRAVQFEPGNLGYAVNFGYVLLNTGRVADAKTLSQRINAAAKSPAERKMAQHLAELVANREAHEKQIAAVAEAAKHANDPANQSRTGTAAIPSLATATAKDTPAIGSNTTRTGPSQYSLEGKVTGVDCAAESDGTLGVTVNSVLMKFHYTDLSRVEVSSAAKAKGANGSAPTCKAWKGQKAKVTFEPAQKDGYDGELTAIQFF